jgi:acetyl esterase/lipase
VVFFFGGGWAAQNPGQFLPQSGYLAERGIVAVTAAYRTRDPHGTTPVEAVADAKSAVSWVRSNASALGVDPGKIVASGGSSGGHIAACTATLPGFDEPDEDPEISSRPNGLVLFNPCLDLTDPVMVERFRQRPYMMEMGCSFEDISPRHHIKPGVPPTIIFHGTADGTVPYSQAVLFCQLMVGNGNRCVVIPAEGQGHGFFNPSRSPEWYSTCVAKAHEFILSI